MKNLVETAENLIIEKHAGQTYVINSKVVPYAYHCFEVRKILLENCDPDIPNKNKLELIALLHDIIEDTDYSAFELNKTFGKYVADGVLALTKNKSLSYKMQIPDSVSRIKLLPKEIGAVKMADRICNVREMPKRWSIEKCKAYIADAKYIYNNLKDSDANIAKLLKRTIYKAERSLENNL